MSSSCCSDSVSLQVCTLPCGRAIGCAASNNAASILPGRLPPPARGNQFNCMKGSGSSSCFPCCMQPQNAGPRLDIPIMQSRLLVPCSGFAEGVKRVAKQVQGALPLVGLLSRLASPSGGIGRDELVSCRL